VAHRVQALRAILSELANLLWVGGLQVGIDILQIPFEGLAVQFFLQSQTVINAKRGKGMEGKQNENNVK